MEPVKQPSPNAYFLSSTQELIKKGDNNVIGSILLFCENVKNERDVQEASSLFFQIFPRLSEQQLNGFLEKQLPSLLNHASIGQQQALSLELAAGFAARGNEPFSSSLQAMHFFAKTIQIAQYCNDLGNVHQQASRLFMLIIRKLLIHEDAFQRSLTAFQKVGQSDQCAFQIVGTHIQRIDSLISFCCEEDDLKVIDHLYRQASNALNGANTELKQQYSSLVFAGLNQAHFLPMKMTTERYWEALSTYRKVFQNVGDVREFQWKATRAFKRLFKVFIDDALTILGPPPSTYNKMKHSPPCRFDIRAMGSLGREEACPYSDLEFFILVEHEGAIPYFKMLAQILEIQVASLGETSTNNPVFTCIHAKNPSGLHLDSGGSPAYNKDLIRTPSSMACLQNNPVSDPQTIENTVLNTISLYQSDPLLFEDYQTALQTVLNVEERGYKFLAIHAADYQKHWKQPFSTQVEAIDIKQMYVKALNYLLCDMAFLCGIKETNTIDCIEQLVTQGVFNRESGFLLKESVSAIHKIRVRLHLHYQEQKEEVAFLQLIPEEIFALEKCYWLVIRPLYALLQNVVGPWEDVAQAFRQRANFKEVFHEIDLIRIAFQANLSSQSAALIKQIASHLCLIQAPLEEHVTYFEILSQGPDALREVYLEVIEKNNVPDVFQKLLQIPNRAGLRPIFHRNLQRLETHLRALTDKLPGEHSTVVITRASSHLPLYLKPVLIEKILEGPDLCKMYTDSAHRVCRLQFQDIDIHCKQKPSHPLMEYAIHNLTSRVSGQMTPASLLVRFDVHTQGKKKSYPVLISETTQGKNLKIAWKEAEANAQYTWALLCAILTRPGDGRLANYILDDQKNLHCVDNDISFVEPVVREWGRTVKFCTALFCLFPLSTPLDSTVLELFCQLDCYSILHGWLEDIIAKEKEYTQLFTEEERKILYEEDPDNAFTPSILFREGALATLYLQFWQLQTRLSFSLQKQQFVTIGDLLQMLISLREENIGPYVYKSYDNTQSSPEKKLQKATSKNQEASMTSVQYHQACLGKIPTHQEIEQAKLFSPENAKKEFLATLLERNSHYASVKNNPYGTIIKANLQELKEDPARQNFVLQVLIEQTKLLKPHTLIIQHSNLLKSFHLKLLLHPALKHLDLRYCSLDDYAPALISACTQLEELLLAETHLTAFQGGYFYPILEFPQLKTLRLDRNVNLQTLQITAPKLQMLTVKHNPKLLYAPTIKRTLLVNFTNSPKVQVIYSSLKCVNKLKGHASHVQTLVQLADGTLASGSSDNTIKLWNSETGACTHTLKEHTGGVYTLIQLIDGTLASGSADETIKLWNPETGACTHTLKGHTNGVGNLIQLIDGTLASGSYDNTIKLWDLRKGACTHTLEGHTKDVRALVQLADGNLASSGFYKTIKLWNSKTGDCTQTLKGHTKDVWNLIKLSDGTLASGSSDHTIKLWDPETGACTQTLKGHTKEVWTLIQLIDGTLASGSFDNTIKLWNAETGACTQTLQGHTKEVWTLIQLADGTLASGSYDNTIKLWDLRTGACTHTLEGHTHFVTNLIQLADGTLASGSYDNTIKLWQ